MQRNPRIVIATEISGGDWIDPYAAKRRKNQRANVRREQRRLERLMSPPSDSESESEESVTEPSMWDTK